jgi:GTPase
VGRPNVGKSSLVNRILGRSEAIVDEVPGVTRDRRAFEAEWDGRDFEIIDTGGLEPGAQGLEADVARQAEVAIELADLIVLVVDAAAGPMPEDHLVARRLRRGDKPVLVAANKVDEPRDEPSATEFFRLGLGVPIPVSARHGRGSGDFLSALTSALPVPGVDGGERSWASVAIVGKPNAGKSSLLNSLVGEGRAIVDPTPGTTRDPVEAMLRASDGRSLQLVDTAGMRRQVQIQDPLEYFSWLRSRRTLQRVDGVVLVVDASGGVTGHDQRIAEEVLAAGRACVVALHKWDLVVLDDPDRRRLEADIRHRLRFLTWATTVRTSAATGRGVDRIVPALEDAVSSHRLRIQTADVNATVRRAQERRPHPRSGGRAVRVLYAVQADKAPPTFVLFATGRLEESYRRYMEKALREAYSFAGTPIRVEGRIRVRR